MPASTPHPPENPAEAPTLKEKVRRLPDGLLSLTLSGADVILHAESSTKFYALTTDVQCEFEFAGTTRKVAVTVGEDASHPMRFDRVAP